jgi:hypothetical protein
LFGRPKIVKQTIFIEKQINKKSDIYVPVKDVVVKAIKNIEKRKLM